MMKRIISALLFSAILVCVLSNYIITEYNSKSIASINKSVSRLTNKINYDIEQRNQLFHRVSVLEYTLRNSDKSVISEPNFTDVVAQSVKSVVHVMCPQWQGSGFIINKNIICTARHVVEDVENFEITFYDGRKAKSTRAISDKEHDVGFIWIDEEMNDVVNVGSIKDCKLGQDIFIIGSPYGGINFNSVSKGIISGLDRNWDEINWNTGEPYGWKIAFTSDSAAHPGNSGGAVFTTDGIVRGILVGGYSNVLNCSMPCDLFLSDIENIKLMFLMDKYQFEEQEQFYYGYYRNQQCQKNLKQD